MHFSLLHVACCVTLSATKKNTKLILTYVPKLQVTVPIQLHLDMFLEPFRDVEDMK